MSKFRISIHALTKRATIVRMNICGLVGFQFTLSRRERPYKVKLHYYYCPFQFTLSRRERPLLLTPKTLTTGFQFTLSRRERHISDLRTATQLQFQFTLSRRERQDYVRAKLDRQIISIHALTKRATRMEPLTYYTH